MPDLLLINRNHALQRAHIFIYLQGANVRRCIRLDRTLCRSLVRGRPHHERSLPFPRMLCHLCCQNLEKWVSIWNLGSLSKGLSGSSVILQIHVVDESQLVVQLPLVGIVLDSVLRQLDGTLGLPSSVRRRG